MFVLFVFSVFYLYFCLLYSPEIHFRRGHALRNFIFSHCNACDFSLLKANCLKFSDPLELLSVKIALIFFQPQQSYSENTERCGTSKYGNVFRVYVEIANYSVSDYFRNARAITKLDPTVGATETVLDLFLD
jgi:hypothetical protein